MIIVLAVIFVVLLVLIGGDRGVMSLIALCGNLLVLGIAVFAMTWGINVILVTYTASIVINCITIFYQNGKSEKTAAAFIAVIVIILLLSIPVFGISNGAHISGLNEIEMKSDYSVFYSFDIYVNMRMVSISMIIIGMIGAIMDTAVAVTSSVNEVYRHNPKLTQRELFCSGISIGRDILGTTLNTLYFAYIGEALMFIIYLRQYQYSVIKMINSKAFCADLISILFSGLGCILIIPLSALIMAKMLDKKEKQGDLTK